MFKMTLLFMLLSLSIFASPLKVEVDIDKKILLKDTKTSLYILVSFDVDRIKTEKTTNLNLSLVLDRLGKSDEKKSKAKEKPD